MSSNAWRCSGLARSSTYRMTCQGGRIAGKPDLGGSALSHRPAIATRRPLSAVAPKCPSLISHDSAKRQVSYTDRPAGLSPSLRHGHGASQLQTSKYEPDTRQFCIATSLSPIAFAALIRFRAGLTIDSHAIAVLMCSMSVLASPSTPFYTSGIACGKTSGAPVAPKHLQGAVDLVGCKVGPE